MWSFSTISRQETRANSKLSSFFDSDKGNAGDAESLIRESLQNALDAKIDPSDNSPVVVKITIGQQAKSLVPWMFESFDEHVNTVLHETNREYPAPIPEKFSFVLIEDFNTSGFDGTFNNEDEKNKGALVKFWWEEGISEKLKGGGGSHGVGKVTLSESSKSRVFFAHSIRAEDSDEVLFGYCRLGLHTQNEKTYREYARFGAREVIENGTDPQLNPCSLLKGGQASM